jgi:hypothetical protein
MKQEPYGGNKLYSALTVKGFFIWRILNMKYPPEHVAGFPEHISRHLLCPSTVGKDCLRKIPKFLLEMPKLLLFP